MSKEQNHNNNIPHEIPHVWGLGRAEFTPTLPPPHRDSGTDLNCIEERLIPSTYFKTITHNLRNASGHKMDIKYKIPKAYICLYK